MKVKFLFLSLLLFALSACNKDDNNSEENSLSIILNKQVVLLDQSNPQDELLIRVGNGGYKIVYPKQFYLNDQFIDYSEDIIKISIQEESKIVIERLLLSDDDVNAFFMLTDSKGEKKIIGVYTPRKEEETGGQFFTEVEDYLLNTPDYWKK